jgi:hypothetical protein
VLKYILSNFCRPHLQREPLELGPGRYCPLRHQQAFYKLSILNPELNHEPNGTLRHQQAFYTLS